MRRKRAFEMKIVTDYTGVGKIQYILGQENMTVLDSVYTDQVEFSVLVPVAEYDGWKRRSPRGQAAARRSGRAMRCGTAHLIRK